MSQHELTPTNTDIRSEACAWLAQLETGALKPADVESFREWVNRSPKHAEEIRLAARFSSIMNTLSEIAPYLDAEVARLDGIVQPQERSWLATLSWAAACMAFIVFGMTLRNDADHTLEWQNQLVTAVGEFQELELPDGSHIELNTDSRLSINYSEHKREIILEQGEALFTVAKDADRPFVVVAGGRQVAAIGTAFQVRHDATRFEVTVTEGVVRLEQTPLVVADTASSEAKSQPALEPILLDSGKRYLAPPEVSASVVEQPVIEPISESDIRRKLAWKEGLLDFSNTPIETIIQEVSRYHDLDIQIADPELKSLEFGGLFRAGDVEPVLQALSRAYGIEAEYLDERTIRLTRTSQG